MIRSSLLLLSCIALSGCVGTDANPLAIFGPNHIPAPGWQSRDSKEYYAAVDVAPSTAAATPAASNSPPAATASTSIPTTSTVAAQPSSAATNPSPKPSAASTEPPIRIVESAAPKREPVEISRLPAPPPSANPPAGSSQAPGLLPRGASIPFKGKRTFADSNVAPAAYTTPDPTASQWRAR